jgi:UDP-N-acetylmuramate dehydrogenase
MREAITWTVPFPFVSPVETPAQAILAEHTTVRLGGPAATFVVAETESELVSSVRACDESARPLLILGGGSNLLVGDAGFPGTVVRVATSGWNTTNTEDGLLVDVAAGHNWDELVAELTASGICGLECLSGIPGSVGAAPIQNIGAYGSEVSELLHSVEFYDRQLRQVRSVPAADLGLAYRTSLLKGTDKGVVLRVRFILTELGLSSPIRYAELARTLGAEMGATVPVAKVRDAVLSLRKTKGMVLDEADHDTWSSGSFFTNPIIPGNELQAILDRISAIAGDSSIPRYPAGDGAVKLSAAWLIERAGFAKGYPGPGNRVSLSTKHTLALTNRGSATTEDLLALAREVRSGVLERFGVELQPEPLLINCSL